MAGMTMSVSATLLTIPIYVILDRLHLLNHLAGLVLVGAIVTLVGVSPAINPVAIEALQASSVPASRRRRSPPSRPMQARCKPGSPA